MQGQEHERDRQPGGVGVTFPSLEVPVLRIRRAAAGACRTTAATLAPRSVAGTGHRRAGATHALTAPLRLRMAASSLAAAWRSLRDDACRMSPTTARAPASVARASPVTRSATAGPRSRPPAANAARARRAWDSMLLEVDRERAQQLRRPPAPARGRSPARARTPRAASAGRTPATSHTSVNRIALRKATHDDHVPAALPEHPGPEGVAREGHPGRPAHRPGRAEDQQRRGDQRREP